jgi:hypothetical protein
VDNRLRDLAEDIEAVTNAVLDTVRVARLDGFPAKYGAGGVPRAAANHFSQAVLTSMSGCTA